MNDSTRRGIRTAIDALVGLLAIFLVILPILQAVTPEQILAVGLDPVQVAGFVTGASVIIGLASKIKNALEERNKIEPFFK